MSSSQFRVIIVGGGIAGLSLANMLERFRIDYVLLESGGEIAPPAGSSIGVTPNGLLILDQLGCYEPMREVSRCAEVNNAHHRDETGRSRACAEDLFAHIEKRGGYPWVFLPRQSLLQILYNQLEQKHKVRVQSKITEIRRVAAGVQVKTVDGRGFVGDIVVGADGIYSKVRREMRRLAEETRPGYFPPGEEESVPCHYRCFFGLSKHVPGWDPSDVNFVHGHGIGFLAVSGQDGYCFWFVFSRLPEPKYGKDIPRYSKEDEELFAEENAHVPITEKVTLGDVYAKRLRSGMTALPVKVFEKWCFERMVLIGDSAHKADPSTGHGASTAMETAAVFVNTLIEARDSRPKGLNGLSTDDIEAISREMETIRKGSAKSVVTTSQGFQSILTKDRPMLSNLILKVVMPLLGGEATTTTVGEASTGVQRVKKLPVPRRPRVNPYRFELPATPLSSGLDSKIRLVFFCVMGFALMAGPPGKSSVPTTNMELINKLSQLMSPLLIYTVEGYRVGHRRNILALPILFTVGTQVFGAGRVIPVYATLHTLFRFNNPASRFVGTEVVYALGLAFILACGVPAFLFLTSEATDTTVLENETLWQYLPVLFSACTLGSSSVISWFKKGKTNRVEKPGDKRGQARERKAPVERDEASFERYYDADVPILKSVYMGVFAFQASVHFGQLLTLVFDHRMPLHSSLVWSPAHAALCSHNIYCIWDLRRRGYVTTGRAVKAALGIVAGQVIYGSGATWTGLWVWREGAISGLSTMH